MPYIGAGIQRFNTADSLTVNGDAEITGTVNPSGDTASGDTAAVGFTSTEGLILTGQGSTSDVVIKNDADTTVCFVPTGTDDLKFNDNATLIFGTGSDLTINHDGSNSFITDSGTGALYIQGTNGVFIRSADGGENLASFTDDGSVELNHDNSKKFETTSTGVDITGIAVTDGLTSSAALDVTTSTHANASVFKSTGNTQLFLQDTDASSDDQFWGLQVSGGDFNILTCDDDRSGGFVTPLTIAQAGDATFSGVVKFADGSESAPSIVFSNDTNTGIYRKGGDKLGFVTGGVERMRITDLGRIEFEVPTNQTGSLQDQRLDWRNENNAGIMASIAVHRESDGNAPAALVFRTSTNVDSASNSSDGDIEERMRITSGGDVLINGTSNVGIGRVSINFNRGTHAGIELEDGTSSAARMLRFRNTNGTVGEIVSTGSSTAYATSSDYRLKENVADMTGAIDRVKALAPKRFNFVADSDTTVDGFLAHEAQAVVPEAVTGTHNEVETWTQQQIDDGDAPDGTSAGDNKLNEDGNTIPIYQSIDQSKLVPLLAAALKESIAKIETLETEMTALKARVTTLEGE